MLLKLNPALQHYLWGGRKLVTQFHKEAGTDIVAESWELSCHPDGMCRVTNYDNMTLAEMIERHGHGILGENCARFEDFPVLVKLIDAKENLSVQVHPGDNYAAKHHNGFGKTEMWYVVDCEPGASLYHGFARTVTREELARSIRDNTLTRLLRRVPVKRGDVFFIDAGTIHAIGAGIVIAEIQQNSNLTYRVYDYGRKGPDGNPRELHVERALEVTTLTVYQSSHDFGGHLAACDYFAVDHLLIDGVAVVPVDAKSFRHVLFLSGEGCVSCGDERVAFRAGDSVLITAGSGDCRIEGTGETLITWVP